MSDFETKTWENGETIYADDMNLISPIIYEVEYDFSQDQYKTVATAKEIYDTLMSGRFVRFHCPIESDNVTTHYFIEPQTFSVNEGAYVIQAAMLTGFSEVDVLEFTADNDEDILATSVVV